MGFFLSCFFDGINYTLRGYMQEELETRLQQIQAKMLHMWRYL